MLTLFSGRHLMHVRRALALTLAVPLLLAGCTGDTEPTPKMPDPTTSSSTPEPTDSETPEVESPEAESAEDFIRRWAAVETQMENSGDTAEYLELSRRCKACTSLAETVEEYYDAGGFVNWGGWKIEAIARESGSGPNAYSVKVMSAPTRYKESIDGRAKRLDGGRSMHLLRLAKTGGSWLVVDKAELAR